LPAPDYIARLLLLGFILAMNGFFAASEIALLSVRDSRLRHMADEGVAGAKTALALLAQPEKLLSVTQMGVTLASLGLGWAGEDTLFGLAMRMFHPLLTTGTEVLLRTASFILAFALMTYCHVVIGEVVPKNVAIDKADRLAVIVAPVLMVFYRLTSVFVSIIERSSRAITNALGVKATHRGGGHSAEELKLVVSSSRFAGNLPKLQEDIIHRVLDLDDLSVREVMTPRRDIVSVPATATLDEVLKAMIDSQHSRLPVWSEEPEKLVGAVFFKDLLRIWYERRANMRKRRPAGPFNPLHIMRKPLIVPETKPLAQMLEEFRHKNSHMALVVDEFGTVTGLLTVEDVLEQIVGEIEDEFDEKITLPHAEADDVTVDGTLSIRDFASLYGVELPVDAGFETIAGYMLSKLGHIPEQGESVEFEGRRFTVVERERNRIANVRVEKLPEPQSPAEPDIAGN
jgi:putative hemolysin